MSEKKVTSVNLREDLKDEIGERPESLSGLVNNWLDRYLSDMPPVQHNDKVESALKDLKDEKAAAQAQHESLMNAYDGLIETLEETSEDQADSFDAELKQEIDAVYDELTSLKNEDQNRLTTTLDDRNTIRDPDNPALKNKAGRLGITPDQLVKELWKRDEERGFDVPETADEAEA